jgi:hypothetical protein
MDNKALDGPVNHGKDATDGKGDGNDGNGNGNAGKGAKGGEGGDQGGDDDGDAIDQEKNDGPSCSRATLSKGKVKADNIDQVPNPDNESVQDGGDTNSNDGK